MKPLLFLIIIITSFSTIEAQEFKPYKFSIYNLKYDTALHVVEDKENGSLILSDTLMIESVKWVWELRLFKGKKAKGRTIDDILEEEKGGFRLSAEDCSDPLFKGTFKEKEAMVERYFCRETLFGQITTWTFIENGKIGTIRISLRPEKEVDRYTIAFAELMSEEYLFSRIKDLQISK